MNRGNGSFIGINKEDIIYDFSGVYPLYEQQENQLAGVWPSNPPDPKFSYNSLLLKTSSTLSRSTVAADASINNLTVTRSGTPSTGWTSPYQTDGYWSNYFNGSANYLQFPAGAAFAPGTGDFTLECWVYVIAHNAGGNYIWTQAVSGTNYFMFTFNSTTANFIAVTSGGGTPGINGPTTTINTNIWHHLAVTRSSGTVRVFVNGVSGTPTSNTIDLSNTTYVPTLCTYSHTTAYGLWNGYISNLRYVKGTAVYTDNFTPPTAPLTAISGTSLLTCQSNRFKDNSTNNFTITLTGSPQSTPYYYPSAFTTTATSPGAGLFNGTTDYLSPASNAAFVFGTADFTLECWIYATAASDTGIYEGRASGSGTTGFTLTAFSSSVIRVYTGTAAIISSSGTSYLNQWTHVAVVRAAGTTTLYINGQSVGTSTSMGSLTDTTPVIGGGRYTGTTTVTSFFTGYISNFRIVKGTAVYTGNFTPPTNFLTQTGGTYSNTANVVTSIASSNTSLLVNFADSNYTSFANTSNNNAFIDSGPYAFPISRSGTPTQGSVTPYWPNGYWSNYFNGSTDYLTFTATAPGTLDWTHEMWIYPMDNPSKRTFFQYGTFVMILAGGAINSWVGSSGPAGPVTISPNTWYHVAAVRSAGVVKIYVNGSGGSGVSMGNDASTAGYVGYENGSSSTFYGYITNVRTVRGTALYTSNFTPPTTPLTAITNTVLLTCRSNQFVDNSTIASVITPVGSPKVQSFYPFSSPTQYTAAAYGGSGYFGGSDSLTPTANSVFAFGTGDFTIEFWVYPTAAPSTGWNPFVTMGNSGGGQEIRISQNINSTGYGYLIPNNANNADVSVGFGTLPLNVWHHLALVRSGSTVTFYRNGVVIGTTTSVSFNFTNTTLFKIGGPQTAYTDGNTVGHISNLRVVKGTAVYTGAFTPPTLAPLTTIGSTSAASYTSTANVNTVFGASSTALLQNFANAGINDLTTQNNLVTISNAQVSNTVSKWATTSMKFNGSTDYLYQPGNQIFNFSSLNFTVEAWIFLNAIPTSDAWPTNYSLHMVLGTVGSPNLADGIGFIIGQTKLIIQNNDTQYASPSVHNMAINTWYHIAYVRYGNNLYFYVNGAALGSVAFSASAGTGSGTYIGCETGQGAFFNGYMQDVRVTKMARYFSKFTPPATALITVGGIGINSVDYLVVAGGGGGANGGGGAGGYLTSTSYSVVTGTSYTVTVGAGGVGTYGGNATTVLPTVGTNGTSSVFATITAAGGGLGGYYTTVSGITNGTAGGSGGGAPPAGSGQSRSGGAGNTPATTPSQGNAGGNNLAQDANGAAGGGGGAGAAGVAGSFRTGGAGGIGLQNSITGTTIYYAGGGGGFGVDTSGLGGTGGGGDATANTIGTSGTVNTGGGGGAVNLAQTAGAGGSGIVVIAYPNTFPPISAISLGLVYDMPSRPGYTVYRFTSGTGTITW